MHYYTVKKEDVKAIIIPGNKHISCLYQHSDLLHYTGGSILTQTSYCSCNVDHCHFFSHSKNPSTFTYTCTHDLKSHGKMVSIELRI